MKPFDSCPRNVAAGSVREFRAAENCDRADDDLDEEWEAADGESAGGDLLDVDPFDDDEPLPERGDFWTDPDERADDAG